MELQRVGVSDGHLTFNYLIYSCLFDHKHVYVTRSINCIESSTPEALLGYNIIVRVCPLIDHVSVFRVFDDELGSRETEAKGTCTGLWYN